jgi:glutaredoxin|tara:strand:+ start:1933 stop:2217 length:285 start_codon:yes stop_codon:yes gene_type:complete
MHIIYGTKTCGYCNQAKSLLRQNGLDFTYIDLSEVTEEDQDELMRIAGKQFRSVPQIFTKESSDRETWSYIEPGNRETWSYIGGFTELRDKLND